LRVLMERIDPVEKKIQFAVFEERAPLPPLARSFSGRQRKGKRRK